MAAIVDNLRDRWDNISPRERRLVALLGLAAAVILVVSLATSIGKGLSDLEARNARARRALAALADLRVRGEVTKPDNPAAAIGTEPIKLESYLTRAATDVGITIPQYNPRPPVTKNGFVTHAGQVELRDLSIAQVKNLLEAIETNSKVVVVTSLALNRNFRDKDKIDLKLELATYARVDGSGGATPTTPPPAAGAATGKGS